MHRKQFKLKAENAAHYALKNVSKNTIAFYGFKRTIILNKKSLEHEQQ